MSCPRRCPEQRCGVFYCLCSYGDVDEFGNAAHDPSGFVYNTQSQLVRVIAQFSVACIMLGLSPPSLLLVCVLQYTAPVGFGHPTKRHLRFTYDDRRDVFTEFDTAFTSGSTAPPVEMDPLDSHVSAVTSFHSDDTVQQADSDDDAATDAGLDDDDAY